MELIAFDDNGNRRKANRDTANHTGRDEPRQWQVSGFRMDPPGNRNAWPEPLREGFLLELRVPRETRILNFKLMAGTPTAFCMVPYEKDEKWEGVQTRRFVVAPLGEGVQIEGDGWFLSFLDVLVEHDDEHTDNGRIGILTMPLWELVKGE